jgi:transposase
MVAIKDGARLTVRKTTDFEVCPKCAIKSYSVYDRRLAKVKDAPIRGKRIELTLVKRRFYCKPCKKPFTEYISGISPGRRTTERYRKHLLWACSRFSDLKAVRHELRCSTSFIYKALYEQLELQYRMKRLNVPWPKRIGIDEHSFKRSRQGGFMEFASMIVDHKKKRVFELVEGRSTGELKAALMHIPGRERVEHVSLDLSGGFKYFVREFFPNAQMTADKFHVVRLLHPAINRRRKEITGDKRSLPIRRLLLRSSKKLNFFEKSAMYRWLEDHPALKEIYHYKEALHGFYRIKGYERARGAFIAMTDRMGESSLPDIKTLRKTLIRWGREILNYFRTGLTNGRVEGFNGKAKLIKRKAYGYRSFKNYRLRVLNDCY